MIHDPHLWHPRKAFNLLAKYLVPSAREMLSPVLDEVIQGETVLIGGAIAFAARIAAERRDIPLLTVHLQPSVFMSVDEPAVMMAGGEWMTRLPRWLRASLMNVVHYQVDRKLRAATGNLRTEAGIRGPAPRGILRTWWNSPDGVVCLFPEWYAHKAADWPKQTVLTRFPLYDEAAERPADAALEAFLAIDDPPIVITPGSANLQAEKFIGESLQACVQANRRAIVITPYRQQVPGLAQGLPSNIAHFDYVPFSRVFPAAAAVIHHGGIGTTAQCFAAGAPQLIMPLAHDQPDNANRVKGLGVGDFLYPKAFRAPAIAQVIEPIMASAEVRFSCAQVRQKMRGQMTPAELVELIENMAERGLRVRQINGAGVPA
jgi:rhamnosyltransferase subunit B